VKAKKEPEYRFYLLYDKVYRPDSPSHAYDRCRANGGAAGVDGQTFDEIEAWTSTFCSAVMARPCRA
jgi:hypothetical protein